MKEIGIYSEIETSDGSRVPTCQQASVLVSLGALDYRFLPCSTTYSTCY